MSPETNPADSIQLTPQDLSLATALCAGAALVIGLPLQLWAPPPQAIGPAALIGAAALIWGALVALFMLGGWDIYYRYFYPPWMRWMAPLEVAIYAGMGYGLWLAAQRGAPMGWAFFLLLGAAEGVLEHLIGLYPLRILEKVPWLRGLRRGPVLLFSFFEYALYWALVAWLAVALNALG